MLTHVKVVRLPPGLDDEGYDFLAKEGPEAFAKLLEAAKEPAEKDLAAAVKLRKEAGAMKAAEERKQHGEQYDFMESQLGVSFGSRGPRDAK